MSYIKKTKMAGSIHKLVLASSSPRRQELLEQLGYTFAVKPAQIDETPLPNELPINYVKRLAHAKACAVATNFHHSDTTLTLGADTIVVLEKQILGKPANLSQAKEFLSKLSGTSHQVITGYCLMKGNKKIILMQAELSDVMMKKLTETQITEYINTGEPMDKAGAYAIQGKGKDLIAKTNGSVNNIIGLPVEKLKPLLDEYLT